MHAVIVAVGLMTLTAPPPRRLHEQGRLLTSAGAPVTGSLPVVFSLYAQATGGTALWTETQTIAFDDGYFDAELGATTAFGATVFDGTVRYLGIKVGADPELLPRQATHSVPYALLCENANGDITPSSVSIGATRVIDSNGTWVGPATGLQGPRGPSGVAAVATFAGSFTGSAGMQASTNVTTTATQRLLVTVTATAQASGASGFAHFACYRSAGTAVAPTSMSTTLNVSHPNGSNYPVTTIGTAVPGAGTWQVGWCMGGTIFGVMAGQLSGIVMTTE